MYTWSTLFMTYHLKVKSDKEELAVTWHKQFVGMMTLMYINFLIKKKITCPTNTPHDQSDNYQELSCVMSLITWCAQNIRFTVESVRGNATVSFLLFWHSQLMRQLFLLNKRFHLFHASLSKVKSAVCLYLPCSVTEHKLILHIRIHKEANKH